MQTKLIASAPSLAALQESISRFYCGQANTPLPDGERRWKLVDTYTGDEIPGVIIIKRRGRYRLEMSQRA